MAKVTRAAIDEQLDAMRGRAFDLIDMASVDAEALVAYLASADVVNAFFPAGDSTMLKGQDFLALTVRKKRTQQARMAGVRVNNMA